MFRNLDFRKMPFEAMSSSPRVPKSRFLCAVSLVLSSLNLVQNCDSPGSGFELMRGRWFYMSPVMTTYYAAKEACTKLSGGNAIIASIDNYNDAQSIEDLFSK